MFNEATQNNYRISFDDYYTERRVVSDMLISPKMLINNHTDANKGTIKRRLYLEDIFGL